VFFGTTASNPLRNLLIMSLSQHLLQKFLTGILAVSSVFKKIIWSALKPKSKKRKKRPPKNTTDVLFHFKNFLLGR